MQNNIMDRISKEFDHMSKGQKLIAQYILDNYDKAAFMTASALSDTVGISESTIVRFAYALGYAGYPQLQKDLQEVIQNKMTTAQRLNMMEGLSVEDIIHASFKTDFNNMRVTKENIDPDMLEKIVNVISSARMIYILGTRSSGPLAEFFRYYMSYIKDNIRMVRYDGGDIFSQILHADERDAVLAISFPRYSMQTIETMHYLKRQGCKIISITDSVESPPAKISEYVLTAKSYMNSFVDSFTAPLSIINLLIIMIGLKNKEVLFRNFNKLEELWESNDVYATREVEAEDE